MSKGRELHVCVANSNLSGQATLVIDYTFSSNVDNALLE
jgi:hypothetical protein